MTELNDDVFSAKKEKKRFKFLTFFAGLLTILLAIALIGCVIFMAFVLFPAFFQGADSDADKIAAGILAIVLLPLMFVVVVFCIVMAIIYIVLGSMLMSSSFKNDRVFRNRRGFIIFTIVMDFIFIAILTLLSFAISPMPVIFLAIAGVMLVSTILRITDLALFNHRVKVGGADLDVQPNHTQTVSTNSNVNFGALGKNNSSDVEERLKKIEEMKNSGLISEADYKEMRKKVLEEI